MVSIILYLVSTSLYVSGLDNFARVCQIMFVRMTLPSGPTALFLSIIFASTMIFGVRALCKFRQVVNESRIPAEFGVHEMQRGPIEAVTIPSESPRAFSVPGIRHLPKQIVVTTGLISSVSTEQMRLIYAHEAAHLRFEHTRILKLATLMERSLWFWPPTLSSTRTMRHSMERWADEDAAGDSCVARRELQSALLKVAGHEAHRSLASFSNVEGVINRITALDNPPPILRPMTSVRLLLPGLILALSALIVTNTLAHGAYCLIFMSNGCK